MVDVCMITYNHEAYIAQAIEGFLMQKTNFPTRLVIGEDGSTDGTRAICLDYQQKHPDRIVLLPDEGNLGMHPNFVRTFKACTAKYVALCEGDDYWTDPSKLQKQVEFMEANPDFAICFHRMNVVYQDRPEKNYVTNPDQKEVSTILDLAKGNFIYTASCLFRNFLFGEFPKEFKNSPVVDYFLHMLNAKHGKIKFLNHIMGVYRVHSGGIWEKNDESYRCFKWILVLESIWPHMPEEVREILLQSISYCLEIVSKSFIEKKFFDPDLKETNSPALFRCSLHLTNIINNQKKELEEINTTQRKYELLRKQYADDFKTPIRSFLRNIYYKMVNKKIAVLEN